MWANGQGCTATCSTVLGLCVNPVNICMQVVDIALACSCANATQRTRCRNSPMTAGSAQLGRSRRVLRSGVT
jgi:hypothetical protein